MQTPEEPNVDNIIIAGLLTIAGIMFIVGIFLFGLYKEFQAFHGI